MEDALCAGLLASRFGNELGATLTDSANAAATLFEVHRDSIQQALAASSHGAYLIGVGYGHDVEYCSHRSEIDVVPKVFDRRVIRRARLEPEE